MMNEGVKRQKTGDSIRTRAAKVSRLPAIVSKKPEPEKPPAAFFFILTPVS